MIRLALAAALLVPLLAVDASRACSVCFGDPESHMVKGAVAGILVLGATVYTLLLGFTGFMVFWIVRARRAAPRLDTDAQSPES